MTIENLVVEEVMQVEECKGTGLQWWVWVWGVVVLGVVADVEPRGRFYQKFNRS